jgi:hypothetical protein
MTTTNGFLGAVLACVLAAACGDVSAVGTPGPGAGGNGGSPSVGGSGVPAAGAGGGAIATGGAGAGAAAGAAGAWSGGRGGAGGMSDGGQPLPYACDGGSDDGGAVLVNPDGSRQCLPPVEWHQQCGDGGVISAAAADGGHECLPQCAPPPPTSSACNGHLTCRQGFWPSAPAGIACQPTAGHAGSVSCRCHEQGQVTYVIDCSACPDAPSTGDPCDGGATISGPDGSRTCA